MKKNPQNEPPYCILDNDSVINGLLYTDISDHLPIFHIDYSGILKKPNEKIKKRIFSDENISKFKLALDAKDWEGIVTVNDAQNAYTLFHNEFSSMYDAHFPIKECSIVYKTRKPWLSE